MLAGLAASTAAYPFSEALWLEVSRHTVRVPGLRSLMRILHLSDLHSSFVVPLSVIGHAISQGPAGNPDLICVTGDFITSGSEFAAVLGNHDGGSWSIEYEGRDNHRDVDRLLHNRAPSLYPSRNTTKG